MKKKTVDVEKAAEEVAKKAGPTQDEIKQTINQIMQQFIADEVDNKVTRNNMAGLTMQIFGAIDGNITIKQQEGNTP